MGCIHAKRSRPHGESISSNISPSRDHPLNENLVQKRIFDVEIHNNSRDHHNSNVDTVLSTANDVETPLRQQGQLEITDENLIYRTRRRDPIIWPLRFVRRYGKGEGQEKDIFSFECGRQCETGSGIFVFRCSEAQQLLAVFVDTINKISSQQQTSSNHSGLQQSQSNTSRTIGPITTGTNNVCQSQSQVTHQQIHHSTSQHSENESLREYVNIPPSNTSFQNNISTSSSNRFRPGTSLDQRSHRENRLPSDRSPPGYEHFDGPTGSPRFSFDSSTLPNRRSSVSNRVSQQSHSHQQAPLYVNSNSFDMPVKESNPRRGNSSSFDDVSNYTNTAFFKQQLDKNVPVSQSQKSFGISPNYIQLDLVATNAANGATKAHISPMNGAKSLSNLSRGASPQRITAGSNSGSSNSLHRNSPKRPINLSSIIGRAPQQKLSLDTTVPLPPGLSYAKIDFEKTAALSQLNHNRQQLAVNGNY